MDDSGHQNPVENSCCQSDMSRRIMTLPGQVESATPSVPGFDSDSMIVAEIARRFFTAGYKFCLRYISLGQEAPEDFILPDPIHILNPSLTLIPLKPVPMR